VHGFVIYLCCGLGWFTLNIFALAQSGIDVIGRTRKVFQGDNGVRTAVITALFFVVYLLVWPLAVGFALMPKSWSPTLNDKMARSFRQTWLDRDDMFKPQMPAPRCPTHDIVVPTESRTCIKCSAVYIVGYCAECVTEGVTKRHVKFVCNECAPFTGSCPLCGDVVYKQKLGEGQTEHAPPACAEWSTFLCSGDPAAYIRDYLARMMLTAAEVHVVALTCVDCHDMVGGVGPGAISVGTVAEFGRTHRGHRAHASMSDGRVVLLPPEEMS
jgi:hypothetical protein